ncbi:nitrate reductase [Corallincola spongiicola]|uniref:Nitrate reductase n=1 Tax=Corallincola spongiicola TaxID=2520508 RepID=A0ABY1WU08_9GAMM|nr:nitrate reductase [Corallincola spongiicola]TAA48113.1 nitrate reductase [Corallincola spongiicola]
MTNDWVKTTCPYCGVGCGVEAKADESGKVTIRGDKSHPANYGKLCSKGLALGDTVVPTGRLTHPYQDGQRINWQQALNTVANQFRDTIDAHGPDSVALYVSGQLLTEDYYVANKLMKGYVGSANIDTNSRLCMSSAVAGHKRAFGTDTVPGCYQDFEVADLLVLVGSNLAWCHPILFQRVKQAKLDRPNMKIIVIDPRVTDTCDIADLHLPIKPGSDVLLFNALLAYLAANDHQDPEYLSKYTEGAEQALHAAHADQGDLGDLQQVAAKLGIDSAKLTEFMALFAATEKVTTVYSQGVNQSTSGVDKVNAIINCHLLTGRIGRPGMGPFSITGQPNAMGGREVGGLANMLAAHMEFTDDAIARVQTFWDSPTMATEPGAKAVDLFNKMEQGEIKAVWIMATNPVVSLPDADRVKAALQKCDFVVVSDCIADTDTTRLANVLLPARGWSEKSGTVTNSERRISRQRAIVPPAGEAMADWWIICEVAKRMGYKQGFNFSHEGEIFAEHAQLSGYENDGSRDFDISAFSNMSNEEFDALTPFQWPMITKGDISLHKRFFAEGNFYTPNRRARLIPVKHRQPAQDVSDNYPLVLNSGRIRDQWHTMTRTGLASKLNAHLPEPFISIHPDTAKQFGLEKEGLANVESHHGSALVRVETSARMRQGEIFMPIHWTGVTSSRARVGALVSPEVDPTSGQPEFKHTPVKVSPWFRQSEALLLTTDDTPIHETEYWVNQRVEQGILYRMASLQGSDTVAGLLQARMQPFIGEQKLSFIDTATGSYRYAVLKEGRLLGCYIVGKRLQRDDYDWLATLLDKPLGSEAMRSIMSGKAQGSLAAGRTVCACKQVGYKTLCAAVKNGATDLDALQRETTAGTGCGSCVPELKEIIQDCAFEEVT